MIIEIYTVFLIQPLDIREYLGNGAKRFKATVQGRPSQEMNPKLVAPLLLCLVDLKMLTPTL